MEAKEIRFILNFTTGDATSNNFTKSNKYKRYIYFLNLKMNPSREELNINNLNFKDSFTEAGDENINVFKYLQSDDLYKKCGPPTNGVKINIENSKKLFLDSYKNFPDLARKRYNGNPLLLLLEIDEGYDKFKGYNLFKNPPLFYCLSLKLFKKYFVSESKNIIEETPFTWAIQSGNFKIINFAFENCKTISSQELTILISMEVSYPKEIGKILKKHLKTYIPTHYPRPINHIFEAYVYDVVKNYDIKKKKFLLNAFWLNLVALRSLNLGRKVIALSFFTDVSDLNKSFYRDDNRILQSEENSLHLLINDFYILKNRYNFDDSDYDTYIDDFRNDLMILPDDIFVFRGYKLEKCMLNNKVDLFDYENLDGKLMNRISYCTSTSTSFDSALRYAEFCPGNVQKIKLCKGTKVFPMANVGLSEVVIAQSGEMVLGENDIYTFIADEFDMFNWEYYKYFYSIYEKNKIISIHNYRTIDADIAIEADINSIYRKLEEDKKIYFKETF